MTLGQRLRQLDDRVLGPRGSVGLRRPLEAVRSGPPAPALDLAADPALPQLDRTDRIDRTGRNALALVGALASVALLAGYYVPGLRDNSDVAGMVLLLSMPAAALALPFALLALLLRVRAVWLSCGLLMLFTVASLATDLFGDSSEGSSLLGFLLLFILNLGLLGLALVVDVAVRGTRRVLRDADMTPASATD